MQNFVEFLCGNVISNPLTDVCLCLLGPSDGFKIWLEPVISKQCNVIKWGKLLQYTLWHNIFYKNSFNRAYFSCKNWLGQIPTIPYVPTGRKLLDSSSVLLNWKISLMQQRFSSTSYYICMRFAFQNYIFCKNISPVLDITQHSISSKINPYVKKIARMIY